MRVSPHLFGSPLPGSAPPASQTSPPTFSRLVCVCVFVCALAPVGAKEDKLVAGLLCPFSHPGDFPFPPSRLHPGALYQLSSEQVELTLPQPTPIPISPHPARLPEPEAKKLHQTHEVTTQT